MSCYYTFICTTIHAYRCDPEALNLLCEVGRVPAELVPAADAGRPLPDLATCNAAVSACEAVAKWGAALGLLAALGRRDLRPDVFTFASAVSACSRAQRWEAATELLAETRSRRKGTRKGLPLPRLFCIPPSELVCRFMAWHAACISMLY